MGGIKWNRCKEIPQYRWRTIWWQMRTHNPFFPAMVFCNSQPNSTSIAYASEVEDGNAFLPAMRFCISQVKPPTALASFCATVGIVLKRIPVYRSDNLPRE